MQFERLNVHPGNLTCIPVYPKNHALEHVISGFTLWHHWVSMYVKLRGGGGSFKGELGVPLTVYPGYLLCSLGILGDYNP